MIEAIYAKQATNKANDAYNLYKSQFSMWRRTANYFIIGG